MRFFNNTALSVSDFNSTSIVDRLSWLIDDVPETFECLAQIRYQHTASVARIERLAADQIRVRFAEPQFGVAPGQALVLYEGDRVLGGGWIRQSPPTKA